MRRACHARWPVRAVAVSPDEPWIATGGHDHRVRLWHLDRPGPLVELGCHDDPVLAGEVTSGGRVVTGGEDGRVRLWDAHTGSTDTGLGSPDNTTVVAVYSDGRVITGEDDGRLLLWDPGKPGTRVDLGSHDGPISAVTVMPDGRHVASHGTDGRVLIWDTRTLGQSPESGSGIVSWSRPGLVVAIGGDHRIRLWNPRDPNHPMELNPTDRVVSVAAMLPGGREVTGDIGGRLDLWNPADPDHPHALGTPEVGVWAIEVLPDGRFVTSDYTATIEEVGRSTKHRLCLWDPERPGHAPHHQSTHVAGGLGPALGRVFADLRLSDIRLHRAADHLRPPHIPPPHHHVPSGGREPGAIRAERRPQHPVGVPVQRVADRLPGARSALPLELEVPLALTPPSRPN